MDFILRCIQYFNSFCCALSLSLLLPLHLEENQFMVLRCMFRLCLCSKKCMIIIYFYGENFLLYYLHAIAAAVCILFGRAKYYHLVLRCVLCCCSLLLLLISFSTHSSSECKRKKEKGLLSAFNWSKNVLLLILFAPHLHENEVELFSNSSRSPFHSLWLQSQSTATLCE